MNRRKAADWNSANSVQSLVIALVLTFIAPFAAAGQNSSIVERTKTDTRQGAVTEGRFMVHENRHEKTGRKIHLNFVVLHAKSSTPKPDPFFFFVGGPGQAATTVANGFRDNWVREDRDIVLIDQRGTAGDHNLSFEFKTNGDTLQQYMAPVMDIESVRVNLKRLQKEHDLRMYSTPFAVDDFNDFRKAMGYGKINIMGGSYGTRVCLWYLRRHGETVRTATLAGCAPIEFRNPLYHAEGAQRALDMIFDEADSTQEYQDAFGDLPKKFKEIVRRFDEGPIKVEIKNRSTGKTETVEMDLNSFLESVRFQMYYSGKSRQLPKLLCDAHQGNFRPFVQSTLQQNMGLRQSLALGMLLSVTSTEDVARINPDEIDNLTKDTFVGGARVRAQIAAAELWPKSRLPDNFSEPVRSDVPTLILSGVMDPVTPPKWGRMIQENFSNSVHVVVPTAHDIGGTCVDKIRRQFLETGTVKDLNIDCVAKMKLPALNTSVREERKNENIGR